MARSRLLGRCLILGTVDRIDRYNIRDFRVLGEITRFLGSGGYFSRSDGLEEMVASRVPPPPPRRALHTRTYMHAEEERRGEERREGIDRCAPRSRCLNRGRPSRCARIRRASAYNGADKLSNGRKIAAIKVENASSNRHFLATPANYA